jgi:acetylornithine/succinyldiaminopimelate/putrescine aminotransferase
MSNWKELESRYFMHTFNRVPVTLVRGQGARVWDEGGREYLDFVGGWGVNRLGHCHPVVAEAVAGQVRTLFAYEQYGIEPDIMTLAKGLASGVPIGAILAKDEASVFSPGEHGSTFGGNPLACAAGYATVKFIIDNNIAGNADEVGRYLASGLEKLKQKYQFITDVRGWGLLLAMEFDSDIAQSLVMACLDSGLLVNRLKPNALRFMPPLIIGNEEADQALSILEKHYQASPNKPKEIGYGG